MPYLSNPFSIQYSLTLRFLCISAQPKQTALVTGANQGIGREVVRQLADLGYQVYLGARDEARGQKAVDELRESGLKDVHLLVIDVTSDESVRLAAKELSSKISALDVLVNNAGMTGPGYVPGKGYVHVLEEKLEDIKATYEVNVFGTIRVTQAFVDLIKKSKTGRIVNVGSIIGSLALASDKTHPYYDVTALAYIPSKSALHSLTIAYSKGLAEFNIKVNVSDPGLTATQATGGLGHSVEVGAQSTVYLATIGEDGPTGTFQGKDGIVPW